MPPKLFIARFKRLLARYAYDVAHQQPGTFCAAGLAPFSGPN
jgi:hypothetical protein